MQNLQYDLEVSKIVAEAKKIKAKSIVLHLPDGLKPQAVNLSRIIEEKTEATVFIWAGSNFGACDIPKIPQNYDLLVTFGHTPPLSKKN